MSKSKKELNKLKEEIESVNEKLAELTPEEIAQVSGGLVAPRRGKPGLEPGVDETDAILKPWIHPTVRA